MWNLFSRTGLRKRHAAGALAVALIWLTLIVFSGAGWNPFPWAWNFTNTGAFGDSFGPLSAFMASIAALGAIAAYNSQAAEARRIKERDEELDQRSTEDRSRAISREFLADERASKQSFENTFFRLLETLRSQVQSLDVEIWTGDPKRGHDAFEALLGDFRRTVEIEDRLSIKEHWAVFSNRHKNDLNHYFRFLYHIVRFIERSNVDDEYFYIQLVRAMLSDSELSLLALNCAHGFGRDKFKPLLEKYSLLHNLSEDQIDHWRLREHYEDSAFQRQPVVSDFEFVDADESLDENLDAAPA